MILEMTAYSVPVNPDSFAAAPSNRVLYAKLATPAPAGREGFAEALRGALEEGASETVHVVEKGENLWGIVRQCLEAEGVPASNARICEAVGKVARDNALANPDLILPGQQIRLSAMPPAARAAAPALAEAQKTAIPAQEAPAPEPPPPAASFHPGLGPEHSATQETPPATPDTAAKLSTPRPTEDTSAASQARMLEITERLRRLSMRTPEATAASEPVSAPQEAEPMGGALHDETPLSDLVRAILAPKSSATLKSATPETESPWRQVLDGSARLTSDFGMRKDPFTGRPEFHEGIDLATQPGTKVTPFRPGTVTFCGWKPGYGKTVIVEHEDGLESIYGHNARNLTHVGAKVDADSVLGLAGSTGRSTGPHLHFEIREKGRAVEPLPYLTPQPVQMAMEDAK